MSNETVHEAVRSRYAAAATGSSCCGAGQSSCCDGSASAAKSVGFGYTIDELRLLPDGADLGLGCGNPSALAGLKKGEIVLDLGSGGGIDCFLAAARVGESGRVIGVDMTPQMIELARRNASKAGADNVEFRLGEIEHLPVADAAVDVIISNCVINLAPEKGPVLAEAFRVLKSGGRLLVSDLMLERALSAAARDNVALLTGCIAGAMTSEAFLAALAQAGFTDVRVEGRSAYLNEGDLAPLIADAGISADDARQIAESVRSFSVFARKP